MSIRVSVKTEPDSTVLKVDGRLRSEDVQELAQASQSIGGNLILDLSDLHSADPQGVELLRQLIERTSQVRGLSPYLELLLKAKP
jgi:anti-anti-sigma regulatory factor